MSEGRDVRWGRWVGAVAGVYVLTKMGLYVTAKALGVAKGEAVARGYDATFVLGLIERRKNGSR